jgi:hypothetical protein
MIITNTVSTLEIMEEIKRRNCPYLDCEEVRTKDGHVYGLVSLLDWKEAEDHMVWQRAGEIKELFKVGEGMYRYHELFMWYMEIDGNMYYFTYYN